MTRIKLIIITLLLAIASPLTRAGEGTDSASKKIDPKEIIFEHLGDRYGWEVPFDHHHSIPLPIIVIGTDGLHCFSSARVEHGQAYKDGNVTFRIAGEDSEYAGKVVEIAADGKEIKPLD